MHATTEAAIQKAQENLISAGFIVDILPAITRLRGHGDFLVSIPYGKKKAKIRVKGHGDVKNPCWFSLTFFDEDIRVAKKENGNSDRAWKVNAQKYDFFILVSIPLNSMWLLTQDKIINLIELNFNKYDWNIERKTHKKVEMNFEINIDGQQLSTNKNYMEELITEENQFLKLREWLVSG